MAKLSQSEMDRIHWLPEGEYAQAVTQLRAAFHGILAPFAGSGMQSHVPAAVDEAVKLAEDFGLRVRGIDKAISLEIIRNKNGRIAQWQK